MLQAACRDPVSQKPRFHHLVCFSHKHTTNLGVVETEQDAIVISHVWHCVGCTPMGRKSVKTTAACTEARTILHPVFYRQRAARAIRREKPTPAVVGQEANTERKREPCSLTAKVHFESQGNLTL